MGEDKTSSGKVCGYASAEEFETARNKIIGKEG